jgi:hypothetical protein
MGTPAAEVTPEAWPNPIGLHRVTPSACTASRWPRWKGSGFSHTSFDARPGIWRAGDGRGIVLPW